MTISERIWSQPSTTSPLSVTPDGREKALEPAEKLSGHEGAAIRWALGGEETVTKKDRPLATVWLAAARARDPREDWAELLEPLDLPKSWPDGPTPVRYTWDPKRTSVTKSVSYDNWTLMMKTEPELPRTRGVSRGLKPADLLAHLKEELNPAKMSTALPLSPTVLLHERGGHWPIMSMQADWLIAGAAMSWPQNLEGFLSRGVDALMLRLDMSSSTLDPNHVYLSPLFDPCQPLTEMATLLIWVAFASKDADVRATAKDLLIATIEDGRAHPEPLADVLSRLAAGGWLKLNRLSEALAEVARVSPLHELVTATVLERYLATLPKLPPSSHHVLELLHALRSSLGGKLDRDAARVLGGVKGGSKAAKLTRAILALDGPDTGVRRARRQAWRVRDSIR